MARHLVAHDGLFLGSSSACNLVACVRLVHAMGWRGSGKRVVTILYVLSAPSSSFARLIGSGQVRFGEPALLEVLVSGWCVVIIRGCP